MVKKFLLIFIISFFLLVGGCDNNNDKNSTTENNSETVNENDISSFLDKDAVSVLYEKRGINYWDVIKIDFNEDLDTTRSRTHPLTKNDDGSFASESPPGLISFNRAPDQNWLRVYSTEGDPVKGVLYISGKTMIFVPDTFFDPKKKYKIFLNGTIKFKNGKVLNKDIAFNLKINSDKDPVSITMDASEVEEGDEINIKIKKNLKIWKVLWDFGDGTSDNIEEVTHKFSKYGNYTVCLNIWDEYGRKFIAKKNVLVIKNFVKDLQNDNNFKDIKNVSSFEVSQDILKDILQQNEDKIISIVQAKLKSLSEDINPLTIISLDSSQIEIFKQKYLEESITQGTFLGIVDLIGLYAILTYEKKENYYILHMIADEGNLKLKYHQNGYDIDINISAENKIPTIYFISLPVPKEMIDYLKANLPVSFNNILPVFYINQQGFVLDLKGTGSRTRKSYLLKVNTVKTRGLVDYLSDAYNAYKTIRNAISNTLSVVKSLLRNVKDMVNKTVSLVPINELGKIKEIMFNTKDKFVSLYNQFKDPSDVLSTITDPQILINDFKKFIYNDQGPCIYSTVEYLIDQLKDKSFYILSLTNSLKNININDFVPDPNKDAYIIFNISGAGNFSFKLKYANTSYDFNGGLIETYKNYMSFVEDVLGFDFPFDSIWEKLNSLGSMIEGEVGIRYNHNLKQLSYEFKIMVNSKDLYRFGVYIGLSSGKVEWKISNPLDTDTYFMITWNLYGVEGEDNPVLSHLYGILENFCPLPFPDIRFTFHTLFRNNEITIESKLRPDISYSVAAILGLKIKQYALIGGGGSVGVQFYISLSPTDFDEGFISAMVNIVKEALNSAQGSFSSLLQQKQEDIDGDGNLETYIVINFPDDSQLISFLKEFATRVKENFQEGEYDQLLDSVVLGISFSASAEAGVGGTIGSIAGGNLSGETGFTFLDFSCSLNYFLNDLFIRLQQAGPDAKFLFGSAMDLARSIKSYDRTAFLKNIKTSLMAFKGMLKHLVLLEDPALEKAFQNFAQHTSIGSSGSFEAGGDINAVAGGSASVGISLGLSVNGEFLLNSFIPIMRFILGNDNPKLKYFDTPGVFPTLSFSIPVYGSVEGGIESGYELKIGGSVQMSFLEGTLVIKGDPLRSPSEGGIPTNYKLEAYPVVVLNVDKKEAYRGEEVVFSVGVENAENVSTVSTKWTLNGVEITSSGDIYDNDGVKIATITEFGADEIKVKFFIPDSYTISYRVVDSQNREGMDVVDVKIKNHPPSKPTLDISSGSGISFDDFIYIQSVTDQDSDPIVHYEVQIATDINFNNIILSQTIAATNGKFKLSDLSFGNNFLMGQTTYYIRIRAYDGYGYSEFSDPKSFQLNIPGVFLLSPVAEENIVYSNSIVFKWRMGCSDLCGGSCDLKISKDPSMNNILFQKNKIENSQDEIHSVKLSYQLEPGKYYWQVVWQESNLQSFSPVYTFTVRPEPPVLKAPPPEYAYKHDQSDKANVKLEVEEVSGAESYEFILATNESFEHSTLYTVSTPYISQYLDIGTYYWKARVKKNGIWSDWSRSSKFYVNQPPKAVFGTLFSGWRACINSTISFSFNAEDPENDPIKKYKIYILKYSKTNDYDLSNAVKVYETTNTQFSINANVLGYGHYQIFILAEDVKGGKQTVKNLGEEINDFWDEAIFWIENCPPPTPEIKSPDNGETIEVVDDPSSTVYLTINRVADPDFDDVIRYEFEVISPDGSKNVFSVTNPPPYLTVGDKWKAIANLEEGTYKWRVRTVSKNGEEEQYSDWSSYFTFHINKYPLPTTQNISPQNGAILFKEDLESILTDNKIKVYLNATGTPAQNYSVKALQFAFSFSKDMKVPFMSPRIDAYTHKWQTPDLPLDVPVYWHARSSYNVVWGDWSDVWCFTIKEKKDLDLNIYSEKSYKCFEDRCVLKFKVENPDSIVSNCLGERAKLEYQICNDDGCNDVISSDYFESNKSFIISLEPEKTYYFRARQVIGNVQGPWSDIKEIKTVKSKYVLENLNPEENSIFSIADKKITFKALAEPVYLGGEYSFIVSHDEDFSNPRIFNSRFLEREILIEDFFSGSGRYYWKVENSMGKSEPTCFVVMGGNDTILEFHSSNETKLIDGKAQIEIILDNPQIVLKDCYGKSAKLEYEISLDHEFSKKIAEGTFESGQPFVFSPPEEGVYFLRIRQVLDNVPGKWSNIKEFKVAKYNPSIKNTSPINGAVFPKGSEIELKGYVEPSWEEIDSYEFFYSPNKDLSSPTSSGSINQNSYVLNIKHTGNFWWWFEVEYKNGVTKNSDPFCFTVVDPDTTILQPSGNSTFEAMENQVELVFDVSNRENIWINCLNEKADLKYEICTDSECSDVIQEGSFKPGESFTINFEPGEYWWRVRQSLGGFEGPWSNTKKIKIVGENLPPTIISFEAIPSYGEAPLKVNLRCKASDPEGKGLLYKWDVDGDGKIDGETKEGEYVAIYKEPGKYMAKVIVVDDKGAEVSKDVEINVYDLKKGLMLYWKFDGDANDFSGNDFNGKLFGKPYFVKGNFDTFYAIYLKYPNQYVGIDFRETKYEVLNLKDFTVSFWTYLDDMPGEYNVFLDGANEEHNDEFSFKWSNKFYTFQVCLGNKCFYTAAKKDMLKKWHHIVFVKEGNTIKLYIDKKLFHTLNIYYFLKEFNIEYLVIGEDQGEIGDEFNKTRVLDGKMDELRIYDRALNSKEIKALYDIR